MPPGFPDCVTGTAEAAAATGLAALAAAANDRQDQPNREAEDNNSAFSVQEELAQAPCSPYDTLEHKRICAEQYAADGNSKKVLNTMTIGSSLPGLKGVFDRPPFSEIKGKKAKLVYKAGRADLAKEVNRRSHFLDNEITEKEAKKNVFHSTKGRHPAPKAWPTKQLKDWLEDPLHYINLDTVETWLKVTTVRVC
jgi:hypothetical protein